MTHSLKKADDKCRLWFLSVIAAALLVRLVVLVELLIHDPSFYLPQSWMHVWALRIAAGQIIPSTVFISAPLYPLLLGLLYAVFSGSILLAKIFWIVVSSISCGLLYKAASRLFNETTGRIAGIIYAIYGTAVFYDAELTTPVLTVFLLLCMLMFLLKFEDRKKLAYLCCSGLAFGLAIITEPITAAVAPFLFWWLIRYAQTRKIPGYRISKGSTFLVVLAIPILLTTWHNYNASDEFIPVSNDCGLKFYLSNNQNADGLSARMPEIPEETRMPWNDLVFVTDSIAKYDTGEKLDPPEIASYWGSEAFSWIGSAFGRFMALTAKKVFYFFAGFESSDGSGIYDYRSYSILLSVLVFNAGIKIPFGLIMPLAIIGIVVTRMRWKELLPIHVLVWPYAAVSVFFIVTSTARLPVVPFLILFAAAALYEIWSCLRGHKLRAIVLPCIIGLFFLVVLNLNLFSLGKTNPFQYHFSRAAAFEQKGDVQSAINEYQEALKYYPHDSRCHTRLGDLFCSTGKIEDAESHFISALQTDPYSPIANAGLGKVYLYRGNAKIARIYLNDAYIKGRDLPEVLNTWGELMEKIEKPDSAEIFYWQAYEKSAAKSFQANLLGNFFAKSNQYDSAYKYFDIAVKDDDTYVTAKVNLANVKLALGDTTSALSDYKAILETNPNQIQVCYNLAAVNLMQHRITEARRYAERCLEINSTYQPALQLLQVMGGK